MNTNNLKSIIGLMFMSFLLTAFTPTDVLAQGKQKSSKTKARTNTKPSGNHNNAKPNNTKPNNNVKPSNTKPNNNAKPNPINTKRGATPVKHYSNQPKRGAVVHVLPQQSLSLRHNNISYHYQNGIFYRPMNGTYIVSAPPIGIHISILPPNPYPVILSGRSYYYYYGTYYQAVNNGGYQIVAPPLGARVDALPDGYEVFEIEGVVYYRLDETYYKAFLEPSGYVTYEVVRV